MELVAVSHFPPPSLVPCLVQAFFHGCARSARNFFPYDPLNCPECLGERRVGSFPASPGCPAACASQPCHSTPPGRRTQPGLLGLACSASMHQSRPAPVNHHHTTAPHAGFPEHLSHTKQALARGYNVLALEPHDSKGLCWSSSDKGIYINDQPQVGPACAACLGCALEGAGE